MNRIMYFKTNKYSVKCENVHFIERKLQYFCENNLNLKKVLQLFRKRYENVHYIIFLLILIHIIENSCNIQIYFGRKFHFRLLM